jgi:hypothetical protein
MWDQATGGQLWRLKGFPCSHMLTEKFPVNVKSLVNNQQNFSSGCGLWTAPYPKWSFCLNTIMCKVPQISLRNLTQKERCLVSSKIQTQPSICKVEFSQIFMPGTVLEPDSSQNLGLMLDSCHMPDPRSQNSWLLFITLNITSLWVGCTLSAQSPLFSTLWWKPSRKKQFAGDFKWKPPSFSLCIGSQGFFKK